MKATKENRWKIATGLMFIICLGLIGAVVVLAMQMGAQTNGVSEVKVEEAQKENGPSLPPLCGPENVPEDIDPSEAEFPGVFDDLTAKELKGVLEYLHGVPSLNLMNSSKARLNNSFIFTADFHPPKKRDVLSYLAGTGVKPDRNARVVIFRGDATPQVVEEYIVGPLPRPNRHEPYTNSIRNNSVPYVYRPFSWSEYAVFYEKILPELDLKIGHVLMESYGATFTKCKRCLSFFDGPIGGGVIGQKVRKTWVVALRVIEYYSIHPLDFYFLMNLNDTQNFHVEKLMYAGQEYSSADELSLKYNTTDIPKTRVPFPEVDRNLLSTMNRRGETVPKEPLRPPRMHEPDGKRYTLRHRSVEYMQWKFDFRMSTTTGPKIYNVRFNNERIAYEVGLKELAVLYYGDNPTFRSANYMDSTFLMGTLGRSLVPGVDCPETSTFTKLSYIADGKDDPVTQDKTFCLFELNTGVPLRRHHDPAKGGFYSGIVDNVLVLRSVLAIFNYDYVIDFVFHQNGALEVHKLASGYLFASFSTQSETPYGFQIEKNLLGNAHQHLSLFKVDVDIHGTKNRYETLDISLEEVQNEQVTGDPNSTLFQLRQDRNLKRTEQEAVYRFNFSLPKYHLIHNNNFTSTNGIIKAYRLHMNGMVNTLMPENRGNEATFSWARHQMAFSKAKDDEDDASSLYAQYDSLEPVVKFADRLEDNENIVDEDLVTWISLGVQHIPHTEDLSVTATPGTQVGFMLLPYNYFKECPSAQSRDSIRVEPKDPDHLEKGVRVERYGYPSTTECVARSPDYDKEVELNPAAILEQP